MNSALENKVALITGSTRGIGLSVAQSFARAGARVIISSRKPEACAHVRDSLVAEGLEAVALPCHVGKPEELQRLVDATIQAYGRLDLVVANAALNPVLAPLQELTEETWSRVLNVNLTSTWRLAKLTLPHLAASGGGAMVLISSIASLIASRGDGGIYAISKAGENHLARQLAMEWGRRNIRVNVIAPGATRTDMIRNVPAETIALLERRTPLGRLAEPADIAAIALFLASDAARHVTGQVLVADGGFTLDAAR